MSACVLCIFVLALTQCYADNLFAKHDLILIDVPPIIVTTSIGNTLAFSITKVNGTNISLSKPHEDDIIELDCQNDPKPLQYGETVYKLFDNGSRQDLDEPVREFNDGYLESFVNRQPRKEYDFDKCDIFIRFGPLLAKDHGNWVFSVIYLEDGVKIEKYQVVTVELVENVFLSPLYTSLTIGGTYEVELVNPVPNHESCELVTPGVARDRAYDRSSSAQELCGFVLRNVTMADTGFYEIIAVGDIVYKGLSYLNVYNVPTKFLDKSITNRI